VAASGGDRSFTAPLDLSTYLLSAPEARYLVAKLVAPGDALCKALLPELYEPVLTSIGNGLIVLRRFGREGKALTQYPSECIIPGAQSPLVTQVTPANRLWPASCSSIRDLHTAGGDMATEPKVVTVRPGPNHQWQVFIDGQNGALSFSARHLAIEFGIACAKLRRATKLEVFNEKGVIERVQDLSGQPPAGEEKLS
jgi:hypothetical protein